MTRRLVMTALTLVIALSASGFVYAQAQFLGAALCCQASCTQLQHGDPMQCCKVHVAQEVSATAPAQLVTADRLPMAILAVANSGVVLTASSGSVLVRNQAPPLLTHSPYFLCSLQI